MSLILIYYHVDYSRLPSLLTNSKTLAFTICHQFIYLSTSDRYILVSELTWTLTGFIYVMFIYVMFIDYQKHVCNVHWLPKTMSVTCSILWDTLAWRNSFLGLLPWRHSECPGLRLFSWSIFPVHGLAPTGSHSRACPRYLCYTVGFNPILCYLFFLVHIVPAEVTGSCFSWLLCSSDMST